MNDIRAQLEKGVRICDKFNRKTDWQNIMNNLGIYTIIFGKLNDRIIDHFKA